MNSLEKLGNVRKSNSKTLKFQWRDIISDYEFLLSILSTLTDGTEQYYPNCYNVNDVKGLQILSQLHYHFTLGGYKLDIDEFNWGFSKPAR